MIRNESVYCGRHLVVIKRKGEVVPVIQVKFFTALCSNIFSIYNINMKIMYECAIC